MTIEPEQQERAFEQKMAQQKVALFERQFGEAYRLLAYHSALPLVLTPELVHYLRTEFLLDQVPWEAEADLLLSELCSQVGYELYAMDASVRSYLLQQMQADPRIPSDRMQAVAQVLISYVAYLSHVDPGQRERELQAQRWAAMAYLGDEDCRRLAQEIAEQFEASSGQGSSTSVKAEFARLAQITQELGSQLQRYPELVTFAKRVSQALRSPESLTAAERRQAFRVEDRVLRLPGEVVPDSEIDDLSGLKTFEFKVVKFVETEGALDQDSQSLQRLPHEFEVATIQIPSVPPLAGIQCLGTAQILVIDADDEEEALVSISGDDLQWKNSVEDEQQMGAEICHTAIYDRNSVVIEWSVFEYPEGEINHLSDPDIIQGNVEVVHDFKIEDFSIVGDLEDFSIPVEIVREPKQGWQYIQNLNAHTRLELIKIPAGSFVMGSPEEELESRSNERPQHEVTVPEFYMGKYPVTQSQWRFVAGLPLVERELDADPSHFKGDDRPVEYVSWLDAIEFCARLSRYTGREYRLPSEAEWEYACRAGTIMPFHFGETIDAALANYQAQDEKRGGTLYPGKYGRGQFGEYRKQTTPVGFFKVANEFGLLDMHGNVWEWCLDDWHDNYEEAPINGSAWLKQDEMIDEPSTDDETINGEPGNTEMIDDSTPEVSEKLLRGGSWSFNPGNCRSAYRSRSNANYRNSNFGFRVVSPASTLQLSELVGGRSIGRT